MGDIAQANGRRVVLFDVVYDAPNDLLLDGAKADV
jgi:hypothetical protein